MSLLKFFSLKVCCGLLFVSIQMSAEAAIINDLYDAKVAVEDQSDSSQSKAIKQAFKQVLVKVNGSKSILTHGQIIKQIPKASTLIRSYTYEKVQNQLYLVVNFDQDKIENAIRSAGFAVWDKRRPDTILWLAIETPNKDKQLVNQETSPQLIERLQQQSKTRGIEVLVPLWDLSDIQMVNVYDIWGGFFQRIASASERYEVNTSLSARIYLQSNNDDADNRSPLWQVDWTFNDNGTVKTGQLNVVETGLAMDAIVDVVANQLSEKYAINQLSRQLNPTKQQIVITNLDSISHYAAILKFLNGLSVVAEAKLIIQEGTKATFELELLGNEEDLLNTFNLDNRIKPVLDEMGKSKGTMEFVWTN